jgi:transposase
MAVADRNGLPLAVGTASGARHESQLVVETLDARFTEEAPQVLIGDKAYDSDALDNQLETELGIELISPHRARRKRPPTQDPTRLKRYRHRWKVERLFAWLMRFRRLVTRWEERAANFEGFVHLGCLVLLLGRL